MTDAAREERAWSVVRAARAIAKDEALRARVAESTGLSREGVDLVFDRCLELDPRVEEVRALAAGAAPAEAVLVLLSSTVPTAALRALALARAASARVLVRPSRREPHFAAALARALAEPGVALAPDLDVAGFAAGEVHVYGRAETIARVRALARPGVLVRAHGPGMGVAVVETAGDVALAADALAADVVPFDQRGCLSPRVAFVCGDAARARTFAEALFDALLRAHARVPRGALAPEEREGARRWAQAAAFAGEIREGAGGAVSISEEVLVPPPGRHVHVAFVETAALPAALARLAPHVTIVGTASGAPAPGAPVHARAARLGEMQTPPLDGPVDRRVA